MMTFSFVCVCTAAHVNFFLFIFDKLKTRLIETGQQRFMDEATDEWRNSRLRFCESFETERFAHSPVVMLPIQGTALLLVLRSFRL